MRRHPRYGPFLRLGLVVAIAAVVYALGVIGNGFWGYSDADAAPLCSTTTAGYQTCVDKQCWSTTAGGAITCQTTTTVCAPGTTTTASRNCVTTTGYNTCTTDPNACQSTPAGSMGSCTTSTSGAMTCVSKSCSTSSGGVRTCDTTTINCTPATSAGARTCTTYTVRTTCTSDPDACSTPAGGGPPPSGGGSAGGGSSPGAGVGRSVGPSDDGGPDGGSSAGAGSGGPGPAGGSASGGSSASGRGHPTMTVVFGDTGSLVLRRAAVKITSTQLASGELPIGTAKCDGAEQACRFTTSGNIHQLGVPRASAARVLRRSSVTVPAGGKRLVTLKLNGAERTALRHGKRLRAVLTVAASADGAKAVSAQRTITIQPR